MCVCVAYTDTVSYVWTHIDVYSICNVVFKFILACTLVCCMLNSPWCTSCVFSSSFYCSAFWAAKIFIIIIIIIIKHRKITSWHADPTTSKYIRQSYNKQEDLNLSLKTTTLQPPPPNSSKKHLPGSHYYIRTCWKPLLSKSPWCPRCPWQRRLARRSPHVQCWESERASWPAAAPGEDRRWKPQPSRPAQRWCWTCWGRTTWCWSPLAAGECWTGGALAPSSCTHWKHNHNNNLSLLDRGRSGSVKLYTLEAQSQ